MNIGEFFGETKLRVPEVVTSPAVPTTALVRFKSDTGAALKADALAVLAIKVGPVETVEAAADLANKRAQVKVILKNIEDRRKRTVEPLKKEASAVDAEARTWSEPLRHWDRQAETALLAHQRKEETSRRMASEARLKALTELAEAQAEAEAKGDSEAAEKASTAIMHVEATAEAPAVTGYKTDAGTTSLRRRWKVEVIDPTLVPPAYLLPDLRALQAAVDAGAREIDGCNIWQEESLPVRTR